MLKGLLTYSSAPGLQGHQARVLLVARREHQDRDLTPLPQNPDQLHARPLRVSRGRTGG